MVAQGLGRCVEDFSGVAGALREHGGNALARSRQRVGQLLAVNDDRRMDVLAGFGEPRDEELPALGDGLRDAVGGRVETLADHPGANGQLGLDGFRAVRDRGGEKLRRIEEARGQRFARIRQFVDEAVALNAQGAQQVFACGAQLLRNLFRMAAQQGVDMNSRLIDLFGDARTGLRDFPRNRFLRVGDGLTHPVGVADDGFALGGQFFDQRAHAPLVLGIGAFEVRHLVMDHQLEFASPRQRALHAIAHGGDFTANGLGQDHHLFGGETVGICEANRDFAHGAGGMAHFLNALRQGREDEKERDGAEGGERHEGRLSLTEARSSGAARINAHDAQPACRQGGGDVERGAAGAILQRLQDLADGAAIIIGGPDRGRHWRQVRIGSAPSEIGAVFRRAPREVLRVVDLGQTHGVHPALIGVWARIEGGKVQGLLDG